MTAVSHDHPVPRPSRGEREFGGPVEHFIDLRDGVLARSATRVEHADDLVFEHGAFDRRPPAPTAPPQTHAAPVPRAAEAAGPGWREWYAAAVMLLDALALVLGGVLATRVRFGVLAAQVDGVPYLTLTLAAVLPWVATIAACRGYEPRFFGLGSEEFRRVGDAGVRFTALVAVLAFATNANVARGLVALALPSSVAIALGQRYLARRVLHRLRRGGVAGHTVIVVGDGEAVRRLVRCLHDSPQSGLRVVGTCAPTGRRSASGQDSGPAHVRRLADDLGADTVAIAHSPGVTTDALRRMAWALEGSGVDLLVAPAFTDVAGPRIHVRPVSGLPLLQIASPEFSGARRLLKRTIDVVGSLTLLVLLLPVLLVTAAAVTVSSRGPVLFRQVRVGRGGRPFTLYKFRSMQVDAEARLAELLQHNESDGVLFKMADDPRVTPIGRVLRRTSLDELPQLLNVLLGHMSLVGPRPPLPTEVAQYDGDVHRRLLVTPGITGLWQVSGRSDLSWSQAVRLDLYYVENWSVALDFEILWKTLFAVIRGSGAR